MFKNVSLVTIARCILSLILVMAGVVCGVIYAVTGSSSSSGAAFALTGGGIALFTFGSFFEW